MNQILWAYHMEKRKPLVKMDCNPITARQHYRFGLVILDKRTFGFPESAPRQIHLDDGGQINVTARTAVSEKVVRLGRYARRATI
jgi:hypothetical protein